MPSLKNPKVPILRLFLNPAYALSPYLLMIYFILAPIGLSSEFFTRDAYIKMHYHISIANYTPCTSQLP